MKTIRKSILIVIFGLACFKSQSQSGVDNIANLLNGRWYYTKFTGGITGETTYFTPFAGDSLLISRIPATDSISWKVYSECRVVTDYKFLLRWGTYYNGWVLSINNFEIMFELAQNSFTTYMTENVSTYSRIDTFTLHEPPKIIGTTDGSHCGPGEVRLEATSNVGMVNWYTVPAGDTAIATGTTYITPLLDSSTVFYVEATDNGCITPARTAVTANTTDCSGVDSVASLLSGRWYYTRRAGGYFGEITYFTPTAGDSIVIDRIAGKDSIIWKSYQHCKLLDLRKYKIENRISILTQTKVWMLFNDNGTYSIEVLKIPEGDWLQLGEQYYDGYGYRYERIDTFTMHKPPEIIGTTDSSRCGTGKVTLSATANPGTIYWYTVPVEGVAIATGTNFVTQALTATTVYYADAIYYGCATPTRKAVTAVINDPVITSITGGSRCGPGEVTLGASADTGIINWYIFPTGDTAIGTGVIFITPALTNTTVYYADATYNGCTTLARTAITASIITGDTCQTKTDDPFLSGRIKMYPNPTSGKLEILIREYIDSSFKIELFDNRGSLIKTISFIKNEKNIQIDLSEFPAGLYHLKFETNNGTYRHKIIKE
jgi:hypothetical protein